MTLRQEKVNSVLQREVASYLQGQNFEGIAGFLTITGAEVTADLEQAKVFFSIVGQDEQQVLEILKKHIYEIQGILMRRLKMRKIPRIEFVPDYSGKYAQKISGLIHKIHHDDEQSGKP